MLTRSSNLLNFGSRSLAEEQKQNQRDHLSLVIRSWRLGIIRVATVRAWIIDVSSWRIEDSPITIYIDHYSLMNNLGIRNDRLPLTLVTQNCVTVTFLLSYIYGFVFSRQIRTTPKRECRHMHSPDPFACHSRSSTDPERQKD